MENEYSLFNSKNKRNVLPKDGIDGEWHIFCIFSKLRPRKNKTRLLCDVLIGESTHFKSYLEFLRRISVFIEI